MTVRAEVIHADNLAWMKAQADDSIDLCLTSPPYEDARTYGELNFKLAGQDWVDYCVERWVEMNRICRGLVCWVVEGRTDDFSYTSSPFLLGADLHRRGIKMRKPSIFYRVGIPGSGGPDYLRNDYEFVITSSKGKLPWSDNTAMGHPPKWAPGGAMSNRTVKGRRVNDRDDFGFSGSSSNGRKADGEHKPRTKVQTRRKKNGERLKDGLYVEPKKANPGNVVKHKYRADEVITLLAEASDVVRCKVGGGVMGSNLAHDNEAPFPETLAEFYVRSFSPPGGIVYDAHSGSGTVGAVCIKHGRNFIGTDIRQSQVELTNRRFAEAFEIVAGTKA